MSTKKTALVLIPLCALILFFVCRSPKINNWDIKKASSPSKIIFFGDSLTTGFGLKDENKSYPSQLAGILNLPKTVYGFNGYTTKDALTVIDRIGAEKPTLVVVTLGGNDILRKLKLAETESNLRQVFKTLQDMGHTVVFTEVLSFFDSKRHEMHRKLCAEFQIAMVPDILKGLISSTEAMQADTIHPDVIGCQKIAEKTASVIRQVHLRD